MARKRIVVAITGASGPIYGIRTLEMLRRIPDVESHLICSLAARRTIQIETSLTLKEIEALADVIHHPKDLAAPVSSGSFRTHGMVIAPCSVATMSSIALGITKDLITRAADVTLKERRRLVLLPRESPMHLGHLRRLVELAEMGAVIAPPLPAFYPHPRTVEELVDYSVARALDLLDLAPPGLPRWGEAAP
jgi:4-hydroxy-3-polyprenylbenzoate decarboxylase